MNNSSLYNHNNNSQYNNNKDKRSCSSLLSELNVIIDII